MTHPIVALFKPRIDIFATDLTPAECEQRLNAAIDDYSTLFSRNAVFGTVWETGAELRAKTFYKNSLSAVVNVAFLPRPLGAEVECRSGLSIVVKVLLIAAAAIGGLWVLGSAAGGDWIQVANGLIGAAFVTVVVLIGSLLARREHNVVVGFLRQTLGAATMDARDAA